MRIDKMFSSKFLKAADVEEMADEETQTAVVMIDRVTMEEIGSDQQQKPVMFFRGIEPGLVLNKTNANTLAKLIGNDTDEWAGKGIGLFTTEVDFQGQQVLSIRVRMKLPKQRKSVAETADTDEVPIPF